MFKNILITGLPKSGKSTLVANLLKTITAPKQGFYTNEVVKDGNRIGFDIISTWSPTAPLARVGEGRYQVSRYTVDVDSFDEIINSKPPILADQFLYLDEIGQMELFSDKFKELVLDYLNSGNACLASVSQIYKDDFISQIMKRDDIKLFKLKPDNRQQTFESIKEELYKL